MSTHRDYTRLVLVGAGHAHVEVVRSFGMMPPPRDTGLTLVTRDLIAPYSGMLPGLIAGHYSYRECHIDARPLARRVGARTVHVEVSGLDLDNNLVLCPGRPDVPFDLVSINVGSTPATEDIPGVREFALPAKPVDLFIEAWEGIQRRALDREGPFRIVVVGGGAGGVELALTMHFRLTSLFVEAGKNPSALSFRVLTDSEDVLMTHNAGVRRRMRRVCRERGLELKLGNGVVEVTAESVRCEDGTVFDYDALVWTTHAAPRAWFRECGLATDDDGFILVDETLRSVSHPQVFAVGDCASMEKTPRPKSGVFAVRQGPYLTANLRHALEGEDLEPFTPQLRFLSLISTGDKNAIASRGVWAAEGEILWKWKDYIDTKFMRKYEVADAMGMAPAGDEDGEDAFHCAGCGAKVGHETLEAALKDVRSFAHEDVLVGLDAPDDAAVVQPPAGKLSVHTVDFFPALVDDAYIFGRITVQHCLSDIYAMGAMPHTALASVTLPRTHPALQEDLLKDLLAGAVEALEEEHTALVGGHTIEGEQLAFGLSVNGVIDRETLLRKRGLRPGDRLVLTKALGTGAIFAADMRGEARGRWLDAAIESMLQSNRAAAKCLFEHGASACTDVTGFGLAGHLSEMLSDGEVRATLELDALPLLKGALEVTELEIRSSLYPQNARHAESIEHLGAVATHAAYPLLFDPQTSGGLLAGIPEARAEACLADLEKAGCTAAIIGRVAARGETDKPIGVVESF